MSVVAAEKKRMLDKALDAVGNSEQVYVEMKHDSDRYWVLVAAGTGGREGLLRLFRKHKPFTVNFELRIRVLPSNAVTKLAWVL